MASSPLLVGVMVVDSGWFTLGRLAFLAILDDVVAAGQGGTRADGQGVGPAWLARTAQLPQKWRFARADVNDDPIIAGSTQGRRWRPGHLAPGTQSRLGSSTSVKGCRWFGAKPHGHLCQIGVVVGVWVSATVQAMRARRAFEVCRSSAHRP